MSSPTTSQDTAQTTHRWQIGFYFGLLTFASTLGGPGGFVGLPIRFFLKDGLHLGPQSVAWYGALIAIPAYFGFLLGFLRDRWRPFGWGDRGYFLLATPLAVCSYGWLSAGAITYPRLLAALLIVALTYKTLETARQGLMIGVAQGRRMTGRLSALTGLAMLIPGSIATQLGGWMSGHVSLQRTFLAAAACSAVLLALAFWRPQAVFVGADEPTDNMEKSRQALGRLLRHRPFWYAAALMVLWNFAPSWGTPLFFFLTDKARLSSTQFATFNILVNITIGIVTTLYILLCLRVPLKRVLWWGAVPGTFCWAFVLFIHDPMQAYLVAMAIGLSAGLTNIAISDLLVRTIPRGLEGTANMLAGTSMALALAGADLFGAWLYKLGGFGLAALATVLTCMLMWPILLILPHSLVAMRDGEPPTAPENTAILEGIAPMMPSPSLENAIVTED